MRESLVDGFAVWFWCFFLVCGMHGDLDFLREFGPVLRDGDFLREFDFLRKIEPDVRGVHVLLKGSPGQVPC